VPELPTFPAPVSRDVVDTTLEALTARIAGWRELVPQVAREVKAAAEAMGYWRAVGRALVIQAQGEYYLGSLRRAKELLDEAEPLVESEGTLADYVYLRSLEAHVLMRDGDLDSAMDLIRLLEGDAISLGPCPVQAVYFNRRTVCEDAVNNFSEALRAGFRTLAIGEEIGEPAIRANAMSNIASSLHAAGNFEDARDLLQDCLALVDEYDITDLTMAHSNMAETLLELRDYDRAWEQIQPILTTDVDSEDPDTYAFTQLIAAEILLGRGELERARALIEPMDEFTQRYRLAAEMAHVRVMKARLALAHSDIDAAVAEMSEVDESGISTGYLIELKATVAEVAAAAGQWQRAYKALVEHNALVDEVRASARELRYAARQIEAEVRGLREERDAALERLDEVERLRAELAELAIKDPLTGLGNRRHLGEYMHELVAREGARFALAMIDLDLFKTINDTYGHATGDVVLQACAQHIRAGVRSGDMVFRYGGEEFCVVLHRADGRQAAEVLRKIAETYSQLVIRHEGHMMTGLTFSAGIAEFPRDGADDHILFEHADEAMYDVKRTTRNAVRIYGEPQTVGC
jgi:diguanylate cyclase (GGDEF)-like protein